MGKEMEDIVKKAMQGDPFYSKRFPAIPAIFFITNSAASPANFWTTVSGHLWSTCLNLLNIIRKAEDLYDDISWNILGNSLNLIEKIFVFIFFEPDRRHIENIGLIFLENNYVFLYSLCFYPEVSHRRQVIFEKQK